MLTPSIYRDHFARAKPYSSYVSTGTADQQAKWRAFHALVRVTESQRSLIASFTRRVNVLVISGVWCGDCVQQCPMLDHLASIKPARGDGPGVDLRFVDRDEHKDLSDAVMICGGNRVPTVIFLNEDMEFIGLSTDKSISRLRALAARQLGPSCPVPGAPVPADEIAATLQDWCTDLEKAHLLARLSAKLRQKHGD
jgi:thiol-disulfide isomerase/thioredoxin